MNTRKALCAALLAGAVGGLGSSPASAYVFTIDNFEVTKNGAAFFEDPFDAGGPPPAAPTFANGNAASYFTIGGFTEAGGRVTLDQALAGNLAGIGVPDPFIGQHALLRSNIDPANTTLGLKKNHDFVVEGVFDLITPSELRTAYRVVLYDRHIGGTGTPPDQPGDDLLEIMVIRAADNVVRVRFLERNGVDDTAITIAQTLFTPGVGDDQVLLRLSHVANFSDVTASFDFLDNGVTTFSQTFMTAGNPLATAFNDENWTRAGFGAFTPGQIPAPGSLALLGLGLAALGFARRKRGG